MKMQIAKLLLKEDIVSIEQVREAIEKKYNTDMELSEALIELGYIGEAELLDFLGKSYGVPVISIEDHSIDQEVLELIPREIAIENRLMPLSITGSALTIAMSDPSNIILVDEISFLTEKNIIPVVVSERSIIDMLEQYYGYSENYTGHSELSLQPTGNNDIDIDEIVRELQGYKNGDTSDLNHSGPEIEKENQSAVTKISTDTQEPVGETEPEHLYELNNDPGIFEEPEIQDEESVTDDSDALISENLFTNTPNRNDYPGVPDNEIQNGEDILGDVNESRIDSAELLSSSQELSSINDSSVVHEEPDIETKAHANTSDTEAMKVQSNEPGPNESNPSGINPSGINPSVLVIDNSRTIQKLITIALKRSGYSVSAVSDGMEALSCLNEVNPDLIFIEINLPHMDGYQVCKIIKSHGLMKQVPVIMLSGKDGIVDKVRSKMAGANGYISKPFASNELVDAARRYTGSNARGLVSGQS